MSHRKISALRGFFWCIEAWRNLRASPQPVLSMAMWLSIGMLLPVLNVFMVVLATVFYGGVISTLHKKSHGETVWLGDFFNGFKSLARFLSLFMTGLPTILFAIFSSSVLINALGPETAKSLTQATEPPSQQVIEAIVPVIANVIMKLLPLGIVVGWIVFLAVPRSMLDKKLGLLALWDSVKAIFTNLGALLLFSLSIMAIAMAASFLLAIPLALIASTGPLANVLQTFVLVFACTLGSAIYLHAMYIAWRDIFMSEGLPPMTDPKDFPDARIEV